MKKYAKYLFPIFLFSTNAYAKEDISFGKLANGQEAFLYTLKNNKNTEIKITNYGGIVTSIILPDKKGNISDIVLGFDNLQEYVKNSPYFGSIVGRYGNRIAKGVFHLNGKTYKLATNNGVNHLHGGKVGFDKVIWNAKKFESKEGKGLELNYTSKDGEEGYPGNLKINVKYVLTDNNELKIYYQANTDKTTIINPTNHSYFNLFGSGDILSNKLMINANYYTPIDSVSITTGKLEKVAGTPFDFRKPKYIGKNINDKNTQLSYGKGYDHNFVLNGKIGKLKLAATVTESKSGRKMEMYTTEPGLQFYSGNFLDGSFKGKNEQVYKNRYGFCLEAQHYPDSPNKPSFPTTVLKPNQTYKQLTIYKFGLM
ncbi:MAG: galactose mutarotase [Candidatus Sericytochromatia bacterium]|nr:galactose mutarotase [Candidatus Sericytochromatia bacterium]